MNKEEIPNELDEREMKIPKYAGRVKVASAKGERRISQEAEIGVWIDTYNDIFSDFDSRPFLHRALSDDFLLEMKRASRDKPTGGIELHILAPAKIRSFAQETLIMRRMQEHFRRHHTKLHEEIKAIKKRGIILAFIGMIMIFFATYLSSLEFKGFWTHLLIVIFEPGGWFSAWTGLDQFFYTANERKPDLDFYEKMSQCEIKFSSY